MLKGKGEEGEREKMSATVWKEGKRYAAKATGGKRSHLLLNLHTYSQLFWKHATKEDIKKNSENYSFWGGVGGNMDPHPSSLWFHGVKPFTAKGSMSGGGQECLIKWKDILYDTSPQFHSKTHLQGTTMTGCGVPLLRINCTINFHGLFLTLHS